MKLPLLTLSLFASLLPDMKAEKPLDLNRVLEAISECEGGRATDMGGRPCCSWRVWSDRTDLAFQLSANESAAWPVFKSQLLWLSDQLRKDRIPVTPRSLASGWRWGYEGAKKRKFKCEYSARVAALIADPTFKP